MKTIRTCLLLCILLSGLASLAQEHLLYNATLPEAEFYTAIDPQDTNHIVLATIYGFGDSAGFDLTIYYTMDFGATWNRSNYHGIPSPYIEAGDPVLSFDPSGNILLAHLGILSNGIYVSTVVAKSTDGGATWSIVSTVAMNNTDKPWLAVDNSGTSAYKGNVYVPLVRQPMKKEKQRIGLGRSTTSTSNFNLNFFDSESRVHLYTLDSNYNTADSLVIPDGGFMPSVAVSKNGIVFTSTLDIQEPIDNSIFVQKISGGGSTLEHSTKVVSFPDYTFKAPDISMRYQPAPYLAIDNSNGPYSGRLYMAYTASETADPKFMDVFLTHSDDEGLTWSSPKAVNKSHQDHKQQYYSSMYVNEAGVLLLDWYDRQNYDTTNKMTDFYMGVSHDGGDTFKQIKLNSVSSDFNAVIPSSNYFGVGEYHQLVSTKHTALSFWSDGRTNDGDLNIYMVKATLDSTLGVAEQSRISGKISVSSLYPQPASDAVYTKVRLLEPATLRYEIVDSKGQVIRDSRWVDYQPGDHVITIGLDFPAGTYIVKVVSDKGYFKNMKLIKR
jgi:hypothetical protein